ncbi:MAG: (2Fe-2S)-binding protein [Acidobacteriota bacterium]
MTREPIERVRIQLDGAAVDVASVGSLAAALLNAGVASFRQSVRGEARGPLCGMGICMECRVVVDGVLRRACVEPLRDGMVVETR